MTVSEKFVDVSFLSYSADSSESENRGRCGFSVY